MKRACINCLFWHAWEQQPENAQRPYGDCRRRAPAIVPIFLPGSGVITAATPMNLKTKWPSTPGTAFCGEHKFNDQGQNETAKS
jgi:hypothetical protein